jgi:hypothetical protein
MLSPSSGSVAAASFLLQVHSRPGRNAKSPVGRTFGPASSAAVGGLLGAETARHSKVEVFGPVSPINRHFVAEFLVGSVFDATEELRSAAVEILLEPKLDESGNAWVDFRPPGGNIYEFTHDPRVTCPGSCRRGRRSRIRHHVPSET